MTQDAKGKLTHFDADGKAVMVNVTDKAPSRRTAVAEGYIRVSRAVMEAVIGGTAEKGDVLGVARVAGIMAVKRTSDLIPLCHPLPVGKCSIDFTTDAAALVIKAVCVVTVDGKTGVEMEALTGVSVALLTVYDMTKALDKEMEITGVRLVEKIGGKSGHYIAGSAGA